MDFEIIIVGLPHLAELSFIMFILFLFDKSHILQQQKRWNYTRL